MPQNRFNIIFERFKTHDITDYRELAYFFGVAAAEEALLDEQAPPESDVAGNTVMTFAAACGRVKTIELLLRYGDVFDVLFSEERGRTLGGPASIAVADESGATPLHLAAEHGHAKVCVRLLDLGD
ncbi:hypothetical protein JL721_12400 [Aureococcus anophagefferens]|nr:hypothetical protein JL721_12400 [Aureococcus anophagefferens]